MPEVDTQYHCTVKSVGRAAGRSAVAAAAYRAGVRLEDPRTGETHDYRRRGDVVHAEIVTGYDWARDRQALWGAVSTSATRLNARLATEVECSLPAALTDAQRLALVRSFARALAAEGVGVDFAIHSPPRRRPGDADDLPGGSGLNFHAHILTTHNLLTPDGPSKTVSRLADGANAVTALRARWAEHVNAALAAAGIDARQDHRSLKDQGIDRPATRHLGARTIAQERKGRRTERGDAHRARQEQRRAGIAVAALSREQQRRDRYPLPGAREAGPPLTEEQRRRRAEGYKRRLLSGRYGPLNDWPALATQVRSLDLEHNDGPRVRLNDGATIADRGDRLDVAGRWLGKGQGRADPSDVAVAALVTLARAKGWEAISLNGDRSFKERAARVATRAGLIVVDPDPSIQRIVAEERQRIAETSSQPPGSQPVPTDPDTALVTDTACAAANAQQRGDSRTLRAIVTATPAHLRQRVGDALHEQADAPAGPDDRRRQGMAQALAQEWDRLTADAGRAILPAARVEESPRPPPTVKEIRTLGEAVLAAQRSEREGPGDSLDTLRAERALATALDRTTPETRHALADPLSRDRHRYAPALTALLRVAVAAADDRAAGLTGIADEECAARRTSRPGRAEEEAQKEVVEIETPRPDFADP